MELKRYESTNFVDWFHLPDINPPQGVGGIRGYHKIPCNPEFSWVHSLLVGSKRLTIGGGIEEG